ncbi:MAG: Threonine--tRNA ligase [Parcubacteria group bacterium ADurb.Bin247]|jgi:threonyl-tRNA synthetase|nr:MAG: Threonine--tRNA ligase [Parcubacteria group bacterium ADurb.Bin247]HQB85154.1 threonine--tRNA ligase [Candidatus Pacearchaeota archaeon]
METLRHSAAHIMAAAVKDIWPNVKLAIGPAIDNGFYYDFDFGDTVINENDFAKIEKKMKSIIAQDLPFEKYEEDILKAIDKEKQRGEIYKVELLEDLKSEGTQKVTYFKTGDFEDLCRGPHIKSSSEVKAFKLNKIAGAYWRGDENNKMLTRIYALAFETEKDLNEYTELLKEAELRDHRRLAKEFDLFSISDKVGQGLILWHPNLSKTREVLETWWRKVHRQNGYHYVYTPHIGRSLLWQESGHLGYFKDSMFPPFSDKETKDEYYVKPMSCPFHVEIYKSRRRSYRDLPIRWNELGTCYRYEKSGELHGLARPRGFTQDDAHIICTKEQFKDEYRKVVELTLNVFSNFGFTKFKYYLAARDPKNLDQYVGDSDVWDIAEATIKEILVEKGIEYELEEGGAKFYGPALDIKIFDAIGREWQCPTIQLDMNLPSKFNMTYIGQDGKDHTPIMIHRTIFGSLERFCTILIEHYAGAFPFWLSPIQIKIISVSDNHIDYCYKLSEEFLQMDFRPQVDDASETVGNKIRKAVNEKVPYILVIGDKEMESGLLNVRERGSKNTYKISKEDFIKNIQSQIK